MSSLEKKFHKLDTRVLQLEVKHSETRMKVKELEEGMMELTNKLTNFRLLKKKKRLFSDSQIYVLLSP